MDGCLQMDLSVPEKCALIKEGWTSGSAADLGVSPRLRRRGRVSS